MTEAETAMTEAEWLVTDDTMGMQRWVRPAQAKYRGSLPQITRRLGSLYGVACVRATPQSVAQPVLAQAAKAVEGAADSGDWAEVNQLCGDAGRRCGEAVGAAGLKSVPHFWALAALRLTQDNIDTYAIHVPFFLCKALEGAANLPALRKSYAELLRDIVGNPFRGGRGRQFNKRKRKPQREPVFRLEWRTDTVVSLARQMYESRNFSAMPILADALQDAGCGNDAILEHCQGEGPHVRGCWVVDLVLGKE
jgi:hypothetical protein